MSAIRRSPLQAWLAPEYPRVTMLQARMLRGGTPPREIARLADPASDLSAAEAHRWLSETPTAAPLYWLSYRLLTPLDVSAASLAAASRSAATWTLRSWLVARWLERVLSVPAEREALLRHREILGPAGVRIRVRFADRLDEVQDVDLDRGVATGVLRAFTHAAERVGEARLDELARDHRVLADPPTWWPSLGTRAKALWTPAELVAEGRAMGHCVGGYSHAVEGGMSVIVAIRCGRHRSTLELTRPWSDGKGGEILQHRAKNNGSPDRVCRAIAESVVRRIKEAQANYILVQGGLST